MSLVSRTEDDQSLANTRRSLSRRDQSTSRRPRPSKRLILCEDGTWLNSDSSSLKDAVTIESNVTRISRAIKPRSSDDISQVVYYHYGVGAGGGVVNKLAGASGAGIDEIIREGYEFLATNWIPGDEIFVFGFSRGAFTARSIAGLVCQIGILTKTGLPYLSEIYRDVQHRHSKRYVPKHPNIPFPDKPSFLNPRYREQLARRGLAVLDIPIKVVGVWETVGALGVPKIGWLERLGLQSTTMKELAFYDTSLSNHIENAFQALALDERRFAFQPTLWEKTEGNRTVLRQVWFPGAHSNVGGGYDDQQIATISLAWMVAQCQPFIDFDLDYILDLWDAAEEFYESRDQRPRPWSFGRLWDGITGFYTLGGSKVRTPGRYTVVNPDNGRETGEPLLDTHEYIHPCVRARIKLGGPGINDTGLYDCKSLIPWKLIIEQIPRSERPSIFWHSRSRPPPGFLRDIPEAPLKPLELEILEYDEETAEYVLKPSAVRQRGSKRISERPPGQRPSSQRPSSRRPPRQRQASQRPPSRRPSPH